MYTYIYIHIYIYIILLIRHLYFNIPLTSTCTKMNSSSFSIRSAILSTLAFMVSGPTDYAPSCHSQNLGRHPYSSSSHPNSIYHPTPSVLPPKCLSCLYFPLTQSPQFRLSALARGPPYTEL